MKAEEFLNKLKEDPAYQELIEKQQKERQKNISETNRIEKPLVTYLQDNGFPQLNTLGELMRRKDNTDITSVLLEWIPKFQKNFYTLDTLVRLLAVTKKPFDGKTLLDLFDDAEIPKDLKWTIGNTIACAYLLKIEHWLENKLNNPDQQMENQMLIYAAIKYFELNKARQFLKKLFTKYPFQVIDAFTYIGTAEDIDYLLDQRQQVNKSLTRCIDKAIKRISKKLSNISRS
jgi:hypothetical protein